MGNLSVVFAGKRSRGISRADINDSQMLLARVAAECGVRIPLPPDFLRGQSLLGKGTHAMIAIARFLSVRLGWDEKFSRRSGCGLLFRGPGFRLHSAGQMTGLVRGREAKELSQPRKIAHGLRRLLTLMGRGIRLCAGTRCGRT